MKFIVIFCLVLLCCSLFVIMPMDADEPVRDLEPSENTDITVDPSAIVYRYYKLDATKGIIDVYSYLYQVEINGVTFNFDIYDYYLMDEDLSVWFSPNNDPNDPTHQRQFGIQGNTIFLFNKTTKKLTIKNTDILEDDILFRYRMLPNMDGTNSGGQSPCHETWLDGQHMLKESHKIYDNDDGRHTLYGGQVHTITISCWDWECIRPIVENMYHQYASQYEKKDSPEDHTIPRAF